APDGLVLGLAEGSLLRGIRMDSLEWRSEALGMQARDISLNIELLPLIDRHLVIKSVSAADLELRIEDREEPASGDEPVAVDLPLDITARDVAVRRFRYSQGTFDREVRNVALAGSLRGPRLRLQRIGWRSDWLDLDASGTAELAGPFGIDADATWRWKDIDGKPLEGSLHIDGDRQAYGLQHELREPLEIYSTGTVAFGADGLLVDLDNKWQELAWDTPRGTVRSSQGALAVRGQPGEFAVNLDARVGLDDGAESRLRVDGTVRRTGAPTIDLAYDVAAFDVSYLAPDLHGDLAVNGSVSGAIGDDGVDLDIRADEVRGTINDHPVEGAASVRLAGDDVTVIESWVSQGDNIVRLQGAVTEPLSADIEIEINELGQLLPQASGTVSGRAAVRGSFARPDVDAEISAGGLAFDGIEIDTIAVSVAGVPENHTVSVRAGAYEAGVVASATGQIRQQAWSATITEFEASSASLGTWVARTDSEVTVSPELSTIALTCLDRSGGAGSACISGRLAASGDNEVDLSIDGFPLAALPLGLPPDVMVTGFVNASARASSVDGTPVVDAEVELVETALGTTYMDEQVDITVSRAEGRARVAEGRLESSLQFDLADGAGGANAKLTVPDVTADERVLDGRAEVLFSNLSVFSVLVPGISKPQGRVDGTFTISGTAAAPEFLGTVRLTEGAFGVRQTGINIAGINLELSQAEPGRIRLSGEAQSGDGTLQVEGFSSIGTDAGMRAEISLSGEDFELARLPDWQISASPSISAVFDDEATRITGELAIPRASVTMREAPVSAERPSPDVIVHREESVETTDRRRIEVDVRTSLGDEVEFSGFGLTSGITGSIRLRGGNDRPFTGQGRVSLTDGEYKAYGQKLAIERGELIFNGPLDNPLLDIRAVRTVRDVVAGIQLSGTPTRLRSELFSEPPLRDSEVLSYLLTGRPLGESTSADDGEALNRAAFALGLSGAGLITSEIRAELGLETLTIEGTGDASKLVAGKRLNDRLLVEYGYGLIDKLGTLLLRYELNERVVLESRTGTVNTFDIVYRRRKK
ncbi:MAG: translocation/assembly module TamB domain-containing protein, partial [Woeseiaceae bacterium]